MEKEDKKLKVYELIIGNKKTNGITAMSLVDCPAVDIDFLTFQKQEKLNFKIENEEKRIITGVALVPDKQIYRYNFQTDEEYYVYFSKITVENLAYDFLLNNKQNNITLQHSLNGNGVKLIESWLSKNENELGLPTPKGTWYVSYKVENDEIWEDVKNGEFKGFSVEVYTNKIKTDLDINLDKDISELTDEEIDLLLTKIGDLFTNKK